MDNISLFFLMSLVFISQAVFKPSVGHTCHVTGTKQDGHPAGSPHIVVKTIKALDVD